MCKALPHSSLLAILTDLTQKTQTKKDVKVYIFLRFGKFIFLENVLVIQDLL